MGFRINTNIAAMNSHRNATQTNLGLDKSLQSLSSGLRINVAADDASGMVIADSLKSQALGLGQAINNANDGVAVVQTADGALDEYINIINTVRTKSIQAASDGQNTDSRAAIQADIDRLLEAADSIANTTQFNGQKLLDGTFTNKAFHIGAYAGETVSLSVGNVQTDTVGDIKGFTGENTRDGYDIADASTAENTSGRILKDGLLTVNGTDLSASINELSPLKTTDAAALAVAITDATGLVTNGTNTLIGVGAVTGGTIDSTNTLKINGVAIADTVFAANDSDGTLRQAINNVSDQTGVTATVDSNGKLNLVSGDGSNISISTTNETDAVPQVTTATVAGNMTGGTISYSINGATAIDVAWNDSSFQATMIDLATTITDDAVGEDLTATYNFGKNEMTGFRFDHLLDGQSITIGGRRVEADGGNLLPEDLARAFDEYEIPPANATVTDDNDGIDSSDWHFKYVGYFDTFVRSSTYATDVPDLTYTDSVTGSIVHSGFMQSEAANLTITGAADGDAFEISFDTSAATDLDSITSVVTTTGENANIDATSLGLTADNLTDQTSAANTTLSNTQVNNLTITKGELVINGVDMAGTYGDNTTPGTARTDFQAAIRVIDGMEDSSIAIDGAITLIVNNGNDLNIGGTKAVGTATDQFGLDNGIFNESKAGKVNIFSDSTIKVGGTDTTSFGLTAGAYAPTSTDSSLESIDVTSRNSAEVAILITDSALKQLDATRVDLGSVQNQLQSTIRNISVTQVKVTAAESQIRDVDFAAQSANFAKLNILAQSGSYAMSQANAVQQNAMRLLQ